jgi:long-chain acyl-CoA synthetase
MHIHPYWIMRDHAEERPDAVALSALKLGRSSFDEFHSLTWSETLTKVHQYANLFQSLGLRVGDRVGIRGYNGIEWVCADWACLALGLVSVPLYQASHLSEIEVIVAESEMKLLVTESEIPQLRVAQISFADLEDRAADMLETFQFSEPPLSQLATIIYTSGTLGHPKGVMHSVENIVGALETANEIINLNAQDRFLSYLPLSHVAERMLVEFGGLIGGGSIFFVDKVDRVINVLPQIQPTIFLAVPRIWDLIRFRIEKELSQKKILRRLSKWIPQRLLSRFMGGMVARKLGLNRARLCFSGAAKLSAETGQALESFGIVIHEAYGLTETLCVSSLTRPGDVTFGSCGRLYPGVESRIEADGEISLKAPFHFLGYYKHQEWTDEVVKNGWFHTGDVGHFDDKGSLFITDRKKNLFKNSGGKYIAPQVAENFLKSHPMIREAIVLGENRPYCVAIASVDLIQGTEKDLEGLLASVNAQLAPYQQLRVVGWTSKAWSVDSGEMTPSLKIKRRVLVERYTDQIEFLYTGGHGVRSLDALSKEGFSRVDSRLQ